MLKIPLLRSLYILSKKETMSSCSLCYPACLFAVCVTGWTLQVSVLAGVFCPAPGRCSSGWAVWSCSQEWDMEMCVGSAMGEILKIINNKSLRKGSVSKQITACQVCGAEGCCHFFHPAAAWMLPFGQKADQKIGFSNGHLVEMNILESQMGKSWADIYLHVLAYSVFPCLSQDGGTYLGERYLVLKAPTEKFKQQPTQRVLQQICVLFSLFGDMSETHYQGSLPNGLGMWEIELHSLSHHPPLQKTLWITGKGAQSDFPTSQIPAHIFSPTSCISGTLAEEHELLRSD